MNTTNNEVKEIKVSIPKVLLDRYNEMYRCGDGADDFDDGYEFGWNVNLACYSADVGDGRRIELKVSTAIYTNGKKPHKYTLHYLCELINKPEDLLKILNFEHLDGRGSFERAEFHFAKGEIGKGDEDFVFYKGKEKDVVVKVVEV